MDPQLPLHPSGLSRSQSDLLANCSAIAASMSPAELLEHAEKHLAEARTAYQSNRLINIRLATAIRDVIETVVGKWDKLGATSSFWLAGAFLYYATSDDDEADLTSPIGFEDDVEVLNACLRFAHLDELCLIPEDYDDV